MYTVSIVFCNDFFNFSKFLVFLAHFHTGRRKFCVMPWKRWQQRPGQGATRHAAKTDWAYTTAWALTVQCTPNTKQLLQENETARESGALLSSPSSESSDVSSSKAEDQPPCQKLLSLLPSPHLRVLTRPIQIQNRRWRAPSNCHMASYPEARRVARLSFALSTSCNFTVVPPFNWRRCHENTRNAG